MQSVVLQLPQQLYEQPASSVKKPYNKKNVLIPAAMPALVLL